MKEKKAFLREKLILFQQKISALSQDLREQQDAFQQREATLCMGIFEILDAIEGIEESIREKEDGYDKTARGLARNIRSIHKKLIRLLKAHDIVKIDFPGNMARMALCKVIDTEPSNTLENETILSVIKNGYVKRDTGAVIRKAEVVTVLNDTIAERETALSQ